MSDSHAPAAGQRLATLLRADAPASPVSPKEGTDERRRRHPVPADAPAPRSGPKDRYEDRRGSGPEDGYGGSGPRFGYGDVRGSDLEDGYEGRDGSGPGDGYEDLRGSDPDGPRSAGMDAQTDQAAGRVTRLVGGAFDPGRPGLRALAVVAVVVVLAAAGLAWWSRPRPEALAPQLAVSTSAGVVGDDRPAPADPSSSPELVVAVSGEVREPGLVRLPPGARVADAIEAAGGLLPGADVDQLNLARRVTDGELIAVGVPMPPGAAAGGPGGGEGATGPVNLNTATLAELETLPGIGPALAQRILDHRTQHGPFTSVGQLREVTGIGDARFSELEPLVTV